MAAEQGLSTEDKFKNNLYALGWAVLAPVFITVKSFAIRLYASDYKSFDMGVDGLLLEKLCYVLLYVAYLKQNDFVLTDFLWGSLTGLMYMAAKQSACIAYGQGPGGPINTLLMTQSIYQVVLNIVIDGQTLGKNGIIGFVLGLVATAVTSLGNMVIKKFIKKEDYSKSPLRRFL